MVKRALISPINRRVRRRLFYGGRTRVMGQLSTLSARAGGAYARRVAMGAGIAGAAALGAYGAYRGIRRIKRARARRITRKKIGMKRTYPSKTKVILDQPIQQLPTELWSAIDICQLDKGSGQDERENDWANIAGWKVYLNIKALAGAGGTTFRMIFASPKNWDIQNLPTDEELQTEFLRNYGTDDSMSWDPATRTHMELCHHPINKDRWNVLVDKKISLNNINGGSLLIVGNSDKIVKMWVPLKRMFKYHGTEGPARTESPPVYLIMYAVNRDKGQGPAVVNYRRSIKVITYFRDGDS